MTAVTISLSTLGQALAAPARGQMVELLLDGQPHPIGELAHRIGVSPSTASGHLRTLAAAHLVTVTMQGRHRLVRLASPEVAGALETLSQPAPGPVTSLKLSREQRRVQAARTCYDHLAGAYGVAWLSAFAERRWLETEQLTNAGCEGFARLGLDIATIASGRRPLIRTCTDWTERRPHLAGSLGAALADLTLASEWVRRTPGSRGLVVTDAGQAALASLGQQGDRPCGSIKGMWFLILLAVVAVGVLAWRMRVSLLAKVLGQPESRVRRRLEGPRK